jgi:hypothetical protein
MHESILYEIDAEIARLHASKVKLLKTTGVKPGRPAGSKKASVKPAVATSKRTMSAEGLERIRQAQFKRWAAVRKMKKAALKAAGSPAAKAKKSTRRRAV